MFPPSSFVRNSTLPALYSLTAFVTSGVTVPARGEGMRPRGAEYFAQRTDDAHHVGRGDAHVELGPAALDLLGQFRSARLIGAGRLGFVDLVALGDHDDARCDLPMPCGNTIEPRTSWSACFGSMPKCIAITTDWSNFVVLNVFKNGHGLADRQRFRVGRGIFFNMAAMRFASFWHMLVFFG